MLEKDVSEFVEKAREVENIGVRVRDDDKVEITVEEEDYDKIDELRSILPEEKSLVPVENAIASKLYFLKDP